MTLRLDANEGPVAPVPTTFDTDDVRRYPDPADLEAALAERLGLRPGCVLVTTGADEALDRIVRVFATDGHAIVPTPTFTMIPRYLAMAAAEVSRVPWVDGPLPVDALLAARRPDTGLTFVVSPNNPTGLAASADELRRLTDGPGDPVLALDAAYGEYATEDLTETALRLPRTLVVKTLSKAWGLAGLRIGYVAGPEDLVARLREVGGPFPVTGPARTIALACLADERYMRAHVSRIRDERSRLARLARDLGLACSDSEGNFVLVRTSRACRLRDALASLGVLVRTFDRDGLRDAVRITCPGDPDELSLLTEALRTVLRPQALLFDLDGVLADVSRSYREAIIATARSFRVAVDPTDVAAAKRRGNANDDWRVTHELVRAGGGTATLAEVTARFEAIYQGTDDAPGLRVTERLLCPRGRLAGLARRLPLAIVTGRPRADAETFLAAQEIADLFTAVITRDDVGPAKPDPAPVRASLEALGIERAWMIGDTVDDVRAAAAAGVLPLAVVAPGDDRAATDAALRDAGAADVLDDLDALTELLP